MFLSLLLVNGNADVEFLAPSDGASPLVEIEERRRQDAPACPRPAGWCTHTTDPEGVSASILNMISFYSYEDCDGDNKPDHVCRDNQGNYGIISSANGCTSTWPRGTCHKHSSFAHVCERPSDWCLGHGAVYDNRDCDGDGIPDHVCSLFGNFGVVSSKNNACVRTWPGGDCGTTCERPADWCYSPGAIYEQKDCDGDGKVDHVCHDYLGNYGVIQSRVNHEGKTCVDSWPRGNCNGQCFRPVILDPASTMFPMYHKWCSQWGATFLDSVVDCDHDNKPDLVCYDTNGQFGVIKSGSGCADDWPNGSCPALQRCDRPVGWCDPDVSDAMYEFKDCDGDGIPDHTCRDSMTNFGVISSLNGCTDSWPNGACVDSRHVIRNGDGGMIPNPVNTLTAFTLDGSSLGGLSMGGLSMGGTPPHTMSGGFVLPPASVPFGGSSATQPGAAPTPALAAEEKTAWSKLGPVFLTVNALILVSCVVGLVVYQVRKSSDDEN